MVDFESPSDHVYIAIRDALMIVAERVIEGSTRDKQTHRVAGKSMLPPRRQGRQLRMYLEDDGESSDDLHEDPEHVSQSSGAFVLQTPSTHTMVLR